MAICDSTYNELKEKDVINICDCKKLGRICDIVIDLKCGRVKGIVLPGARGFNIFRQPEDIFIPWKNILRIGNDVILIEVSHRIRQCKDKCRNKDSDDDSGSEYCGKEDSFAEEMFDGKVRPRVLKYLIDDDDNDDNEDS